MNGPTRVLLLIACLLLIAAGVGGTWFLRDRADEAQTEPWRVEYDAFVAHLGGDEPKVRDEVNGLISTTSATLDAGDRGRANGLPRECLDPRVLLEIGHVQTFVTAAGRGRMPPYHFVGADHRARLAALAGEDPAPERVIALRKALARLAADFEAIRRPPDWKVTVQGDAPPMPFLDLLREGHQFLPDSTHPELRPDPRIPAFAAADAQLLDHLDRFFNGARARAAFPPDKFARLYVNGRIPPIPTALDGYRKEVASRIDAEMSILTPEENPDPGKVEAINDTYDKLGRFLEAVAEFDQ